MVLLCLETSILVLHDHQLSIQTSEKSGATSSCNLDTGCQEANFQIKPFSYSLVLFFLPILFPFIALLHIYFAFMLFESVLHTMKTAAGNADGHLWAAFCWIRAHQESTLASSQPGKERRVGAKGVFRHWLGGCWM